jgi:hypothetical protein
VANLCLLKIRWYFYSLGKTIYEYKILIFLFLSVVIFGINIIADPRVLSSPIVNLFHMRHSFGTLIEYLILYYSVFCVFFLLQKKMIFNSAFEQYIKTLPVSKFSKVFADITVLLLGNNILWLWFLFGFGASFNFNYDFKYNFILCLNALYLVISVLIMQLAIQEKSLIKFILILILGCLFAAVKIMPDYFYLQILLNIICILLVCYLPFYTLKYRVLKLEFFKLSWLCKINLGSVMALQISMLRPQFNNILIKILLSIGLQIIALILIKHAVSSEMMHVVILFNILTIWVITIITRILATETKKLEMFFNTLPLSKSFWIFRHCSFAFIISLIILLPSFAYAHTNSLMGPALWLVSYIEIIFLNIIIYLLNYHNVKNVTLIAFIMFLVCYFLQFMLVGF